MDFINQIPTHAHPFTSDSINKRLRIYCSEDEKIFEQEIVFNPPVGGFRNDTSGELQTSKVLLKRNRKKYLFIVHESKLLQ
jgi:hypothetical protein